MFSISFTVTTKQKHIIKKKRERERNQSILLETVIQYTGRKQERKRGTKDLQNTWKTPNEMAVQNLVYQ